MTRLWPTEEIWSPSNTNPNQPLTATLQRILPYCILPDTDIVTAPAAALILQNLFPGSSKFVFFFEFAEEILPLTDFIPFATICWVVDTYYPESSIADVFQLGNYNEQAVTAAEKAESLDVEADRMRRNIDNDKR